MVALTTTAPAYLQKGHFYGLLETTGLVAGSVIAIKSRRLPTVPYNETLPANAAFELQGDDVEFVLLVSGAVDFGQDVRWRLPRVAVIPPILTPSYANLAANITSSTNAWLSTGLGVEVTPENEVLILASLYLSLLASTLIGGNVAFKVYRNTTGVPVSGTAVGSDTPVTGAGVADAEGSGSPNAASLGVTLTVPLLVQDPNFVAGTTYYYYIAWNNVQPSLGATLNGASGDSTSSICALVS